MGVKGLVALATATIALLVGPGAAFAQDEGTAGTPADPAVTDSTVTQEQQPADTSGGGDTSSVADTTNDVSTSSDPVVDASSTAATETTDTAAADPDATEASAPDQSQPQVETSVASADVRTASAVKQSGDTCGLRTAGATTSRVGPPGPGCTRVDGGQISSDPANPTVLPAINGVVVAIWIVDTANGPEVHYRIQSGSFSGTDAIDLKVKGGPDPNGFTCQVTNANITTEGVCHAPVNPNNGKFYGVSHVDACPGSTTSPPVNTPPGGGAGGVAGQVEKGGQNKKGVTVSPEVGGGGAAPALAASVAGAAGGLPVTGIAALWLFLIGGALLAGGALVRIRIN